MIALGESLKLTFTKAHLACHGANAKIVSVRHRIDGVSKTARKPCSFCWWCIDFTKLAAKLTPEVAGELWVYAQTGAVKALSAEPELVVGGFKLQVWTKSSAVGLHWSDWRMLERSPPDSALASNQGDQLGHTKIDGVYEVLHRRQMMAANTNVSASGGVYVQSHMRGYRSHALRQRLQCGAPRRQILRKVAHCPEDSCTCALDRKSECNGREPRRHHPPQVDHGPCSDLECIQVKVVLGISQRFE
ncbi:MAG: hypothetical protein AAF411_13530 [Myxococcota bacterium]